MAKQKVLFPEEFSPFGMRDRKDRKIVEVQPEDQAIDIFNKIRTWEINEQLAIAIQLSNSSFEIGDELMNTIQAAKQNESYESHIKVVKQQINLMSLPVSSLMPIEIPYFMVLFFNKYQYSLGSACFEEDIQGEVILLHGCIEYAKHRRDLEGDYNASDEETFTDQITNFSRFELYLRALLNNLIQNSHNTHSKRESLISLENTFISASQLQTLYEILKDYFLNIDHNNLLETLTNGRTSPSKLFFQGRANQLCDTFKQLYDNNYIPGYFRKDVERWLISNFQSRKDGKATDLNPTTTEKSISGDEYVCQSPLIEIENGVIMKATKKQKKKY